MTTPVTPAAPATTAAPAPVKAAKKGKKIVESEGVAHIAATFNNLLITITDMKGNTLVWGSAGKAGFKGSKKSTPFAATVAAENCGREAMNLGLRRVHVRVQGPGSGRDVDCSVRVNESDSRRPPISVALRVPLFYGEIPHFVDYPLAPVSQQPVLVSREAVRTNEDLVRSGVP